MRRSAVVLFLLGLGGSLLAQPSSLLEWTFKEEGDLKGWGMPNHVADLTAQDGAMQGRVLDWDPFVRSPQFDIPATAWQEIEIRLRTNLGGDAEFFWTGTTESPYGGFAPGKETVFSVAGDNQWHTYRIRPFWQKEGRIILLRLDLPKPPDALKGRATFAVDYIRVVDPGRPDPQAGPPAWDFAVTPDGWTAHDGLTVVFRGAQGVELASTRARQGFLRSDPIQFAARQDQWVAIEMAAENARAAYFTWVSSDRNHEQSRKVRLRPDGQFHTYNLELGKDADWAGEILMLGLEPPRGAAPRLMLRRIAVTNTPQGGPDVDPVYAGFENALNRAGSPLSFVVHLVNRGGESARGLRMTKLELPQGMTVSEGTDGWRDLPTLAPREALTHRMTVRANQATAGRFALTLEGPGAPVRPVTGELRVTASLGLPPADYVPEPQPIESDYEVGAFYFPGWPTQAKWEPVRRVTPERKPVLGWYDESSPVAADWQIKWAVENGIRFFLVDWYWNDGRRQLEHWLHEAYFKARYRRYLKWAVMWANHNPPHTHSEADQRAVTRYWIEQYFHQPEYYRIEGKPVVVIWNDYNMNRDLEGQGGAGRLLAISQELAVQAGYAGIWFVGMKWPEASTDRAVMERLREEGFAMTSIYHYMDHGGRAADPREFPFRWVAESSSPFWRARHEAGVLPFLPNLATGWDSRPWHGDQATVIYDRIVPWFRRICEEAKRFADETGQRRLVLAPVNEWGEGSYIEPCTEYGFEMYETIRDLFGRKPAGGWPVNFGPSDVGLTVPAAP